MIAAVKPWEERMPAPIKAFECALDCSGIGLGCPRAESCGDCARVTIYGDAVKARDAEIADLRAALAAGVAAAPAEILKHRAEGRAEALAILLDEDPEIPLEAYTPSRADGGDSGEYNTYWDEPKLRALFHVDDATYSAFDKAEAEFHHYIGLQDEARYANNFATNMNSSGKVRDVLEKSGEYDLLAQLLRDPPSCQECQAREAAISILKDQDIRVLWSATWDTSIKAAGAGIGNTDAAYNLHPIYFARAIERKLGAPRDLSELARILSGVIPFRTGLIRKGQCVDASCEVLELVCRSLMGELRLVAPACAESPSGPVTWTTEDEKRLDLAMTDHFGPIVPAAKPAADSWITSTVARHLDLAFRNGVSAGWNAGVTGDGEELSKLKNRVGTRAEYAALFPPDTATTAQPGSGREAALVGLVAALENIVEMNVQYCIDKYGDKSRAESMSCVVVARAAIDAAMSAPAQGENGGAA